MKSQLMPMLTLVLFIFIMYFLLIRPQKKREKAVTSMRNAIKVGDEVITIGGICGKIVKTKDETLTIQVGSDKTKFEVMRWAVSKVVNEETAPAKKSKKAISAPAEEAKEEPVKKTLPKKMKKVAETEAPEKEEPVQVEAEVVEETEVKKDEE